MAFSSGYSEEVGGGEQRDDLFLMENDVFSHPSYSVRDILEEVLGGS